MLSAKVLANSGVTPAKKAKPVVVTVILILTYFYTNNKT